MSFGNAGVTYTPTSFLTPWMRCLSISSMMTARSFFSCSLRASLRYMYTVMNGAWPFVVMSVTTWYWIVCTPRTISSRTRFSTISAFFAGSTAAPTSASSSSTSCVIFSRLTCTSAADHRAVLQHVLEVHEVAVVHPLRVVVHVVEMQDAGVVRLHDLLRQQQALRHVLRHGAGHVVALHAVDRRVLVRVLLLRLLVRAVDEREDLAVRRVVLALEGLDEAVRDVLLRHQVRARLLDLRLHQVLNLLHAQRAVMRSRELLNLLRDPLDARLRQLVRIVHRGIGLADGDDDLRTIERRFLAAALDYVHCSPFSFLSFLWLKFL